MKNSDEKYIKIIPSSRQLKHQQLEFYAFFHFTVNTFTNKEWGDGTESPDIFEPVKMDARQWILAIKAAGMKAAILTCKHHDGFCLWPSKYTTHTVASSPYLGGKGDIVKEVSEACREEGLKFGIYLSPWDRNQEVYGQGTTYDDYFVNQLKELLTGYGDIFCVWLDGACGEGANGKRQVYDWERYYETIRRFQPEACISVCGPDIRWCGNESGNTRQSEWSVVPEYLAKAELIQENSQKEDNTEFRQQSIKSSDLDLGSRNKLAAADKLIWYPAEVNMSIRPGWFYHPEEDDKICSADDLWNIYYKSVGGNSTFLLNIPPTPEGLLHSKDVAVIKDFGQLLQKQFQNNLILDAHLSADSEDEHHTIDQVRCDNYEEYFKTPDGQTKVDITIELNQISKVTSIVLKENIRLSQRVELFEIWAGEQTDIQKVYEGTVIGYKRIIPLASIQCNRIFLRILDSRVCPTLSFIGVYS